MIIKDILLIVDIMVEDFTTLSVSKDLRDRIAKFGTKDETFESILQKIVKFYEDNNGR